MKVKFLVMMLTILLASCSRENDFSNKRLYYVDKITETMVNQQDKHFKVVLRNGNDTLVISGSGNFHFDKGRVVCLNEAGKISRGDPRIDLWIFIGFVNMLFLLAVRLNRLYETIIKKLRDQYEN